MSTVRAKFTCGSKMTTPDGGTVVYMYPVYSSDPNHENKAFSDATPGGQLQMAISPGKAAAALFEHGKQYYLDITPAE